jgi:putative tricarboxylic transport membrane protein
MSEDVNTSAKQRNFGFLSRNASNLRGGLLLALLAGGLFVNTFHITSPMVPRIISIALVLVGVAVAAGLVQVRAPQDFYGGVALVLVACLALIASAELPGQRGFAFGPGTAPRLFAGLLVALGTAVAVTGLVVDGARIEKYNIRGPVLVIGAILCFSVMIRGYSLTIPLLGLVIVIPPLGLIIASYVTFVVAMMGSREVRIVEAFIGAAVMTGFCVLLFVYILNLPFQLWPRF